MLCADTPGLEMAGCAEERPYRSPSSDADLRKQRMREKAAERGKPAPSRAYRIQPSINKRFPGVVAAACTPPREQALDNTTYDDAETIAICSAAETPLILRKIQEAGRGVQLPHPRRTPSCGRFIDH